MCFWCRSIPDGIEFHSAICIGAFIYLTSTYNTGVYRLYQKTRSILRYSFLILYFRLNFTEKTESVNNDNTELERKKEEENTELEREKVKEKEEENTELEKEKEEENTELEREKEEENVENASLHKVGNLLQEAQHVCSFGLNLCNFYMEEFSEERYIEIFDIRTG